MIPFEDSREYSSFRDPSGCIYTHEGILYRRIAASYFRQYDKLMDCGLYNEMRKFDAITEHQMIRRNESEIIIQPEKIPYISYPYEWTFGELRDAALLTLKIHRRAMRHDMVLKDASAYNIQFKNGKPILIDTLSFDFYEEGEPWGGYGQFCRHFLAPLLLMKEKDLRLNRMLSLFIDGIPLDLAAALLGNKGGLLAKEHIVWHSKSIARHNGDGKRNMKKKSRSVSVTRKGHLAFIESLIRGIEGLRLKTVETEWGDYYAHTNYSEEASAEKKRIAEELINQVSPVSVWDMGANDGTYSKLALLAGAHVVAFDIDPMAVERNYNEVKRTHSSMLPLVLDITNPSPGIGFANKERTMIGDRQKPDCILALALIHHLAISNNLSFDMIAEWFSELSDHLIIEFVPKEDSQVQILLATRKDIFAKYTMPDFEEAFSKFYMLCEKKPIPNSRRVIYLWKKEQSVLNMKK